MADESPKSYEQTGRRIFFFLPSCATATSVTSLCWFTPCIWQLDSFQKWSLLWTELCLPHLHTSCLILTATIFGKDIFSRQSMNDKLRWLWYNRIVDPRRRERCIFLVLHSMRIEWEVAICKLDGESTRANNLNDTIFVFANKYTSKIITVWWTQAIVLCDGSPTVFLTARVLCFPMNHDLCDSTSINCKLTIPILTPLMLIGWKISEVI